MNSVTESTQHTAGTDPMDLLRRFHYGEPAAVASTEPPAGAILPALLDPYRDAAAVWHLPTTSARPASRGRLGIFSRTPSRRLRRAMTVHGS